VERLSLAYRDLSEVPPRIGEQFGQFLKELDLSNNELSDLTNLRDFQKLEVLVLDNNKLTSHTKIPSSLRTVHTLWVNNNEIANLSLFVDKLVASCPNLKFLSMLRNKACPNFFNGGTPKQYTDYRKYVIDRLRSLSVLDSSAITEQEREEAYRTYGSLPASFAPVANENVPPLNSAEPNPSLPAKPSRKERKKTTQTTIEKKKRKNRRSSPTSSRSFGPRK